MIIDNTNLPLYAAIQRFLVANDMVTGWAELAGHANRSRSYFSMVMRTKSDPSPCVWIAIQNFLKELSIECRSDTLKRWVEHYIEQIDIHMMEAAS